VKGIFLELTISRGIVWSLSLQKKPIMLQSSTNPLQAPWSSMLGLWPFPQTDYYDLLMFSLFTVLCHHVVFYSCFFAIAIVDHFNLLQKYKIQKDKYPPQPLVTRAFVDAFVSHFVFFLGHYIITPMFQKFNTTDMRAPLPSLPRFLGELLIAFAICDAQFYWVHRLLHSHPFLYKSFHKRHHEFNVNTSVAAEYATFWDHLVLNHPSALLGPLLVASHPITTGTFIALRMVESLEIHSGYHFPWSPFGFFSFIHGGARFHEFHHSKNVGNYGVFRLWDRVMGTDVAYNNATAEANKTKQN